MCNLGELCGIQVLSEISKCVWVYVDERKYYSTGRVSTSGQRQIGFRFLRCVNIFFNLRDLSKSLLADVYRRKGKKHGQELWGNCSAQLLATKG